MTEEIDKNKLTIVPFNSKKEVEKVEESIFDVEFINGDKETIEADACAVAEEMPGFLAFWKEVPYNLLGFYNISFIKKLQVITREK